MTKPDLPDRTTDHPPTISVVVPAHNEGGNILALYQQVSAVLSPSWRWELILVDDGSRDDTYARIQQLAQTDPRVVGLSLSRNFGHQYALLAGLDIARGKAIISMDADLQHPPALLPELIAQWQSGANVVMTERLPAGRLPWWKVKTSEWFYQLFSALTGVQMAAGDSDFRLLDREVLARLRQVDRSHLFLRGLVRWAGFASARVPYEVRARQWGVSSYSLRRMFRLGATGITAFSSIPLRAGIGLSIATTVLAILEFIYALWIKLTGMPVQGWVSLVMVVTVLFAINFLLIGMIGVYVGRIFEKVQDRPPYLVEHSTTATQPSPATPLADRKADFDPPRPA